MKEIIVAIVQHKEKFLLLKRAFNKHFDPQKWEFVSGFIDDKKNLQDFAKELISYETGLDTNFVKKGDDFVVKDQYGEWLIHPFLFSSDSKNVVLKADHDNHEWIEPNDLSTFNTVHELEKNLAALSL